MNGSAVDSGQASAAIPLSVGENPVEVVVKAEDGSTRTYTVTVTRAAVTAALPTTLALSAAPDPAEGGPEVTVTATLDHPAPADGTRVTLATAGTARRDTGAGGDYTLSATTITIAAGETEGTATITVIDDAEEDGGETIVLGAAGTNPSLTASLTLTIEDNDVTPVLALPTTLTLRARPGRGRRRGSGDGDRDTEQPGAGGRHDGDADDGRHGDAGHRLHPVVDHHHHHRRRHGGHGGDHRHR